MSNRKPTFRAEHIIAFVDPWHYKDTTAVSGVGVARSRSPYRAEQRAKKLAKAALEKAEKKVYASGGLPALTPVMDDTYTDKIS